MLEVSGIALARGGQSVLHSVSLCAAPGAVTVLVGANGAGKSSLLKAISGEWPVSSGTIAIGGRPRQDWPPQLLARRLAVMRQNPGTSFAFTVAELVALGRAPYGGGSRRDARLIETAMESVGLAGYGGRLVTTLSGGERQRAFLAKTLVQLAGSPEGPGPGPDASVLLLDEPTAALDPAQQGIAMEAVRAVAREGAAVLAVMHDLVLASLFADRILAMRAGRIIADGPPAAVLTPETLAECYGCPMLVDRRHLDGLPLASIAGRAQPP